MGTTLQTIGHATLLVRRDGDPLLATDPWLVGSAYWRSWWLSRYPSSDDVDAVGRARNLYITHSHPDHFHWPTIRRLGPTRTLHPRFPGYPVPSFLRSEGIPASVLAPWTRYELAPGIRVVSVPVPIDDSVLVVQAPEATIVNINDAVARPALLRTVRRRFVDPSKPVIALRSYSPASLASSIFRDGERLPLKSKRDYVDVARRSAELVGATHFVPFASQAFYLRSDARWANDFKVTFEDLQEFWGDTEVELLPPHITLDLATMSWDAPDPAGVREATDAEVHKVAVREAYESSYEFGADDCEALTAYLRQLPLLRWLFRGGVGVRLATSGRALSYSTRSGELVERDDATDASVVLSMPDAVLAEALRNGILTDLGITMFVRVDTRVHPRIAYGLFLLMGLRDYGHLRSARRFARFLAFYLVTARAFWRRPGASATIG